MQPNHDDQPKSSVPRIWPFGFALGIVVVLVGLIAFVWAAVVGAAVALVFGYLWIRDATAGTELVHTPDVPPESASGAALAPTEGPPAMPPATLDERYPRSKFLIGATLGVGGVIGGLVSAPALGFMIAPPFLNQGTKDHDIGPMSDFPENTYVVATWTSDESQGVVSRRTAYVRYNGELNNLPSFTILSNHCAHLGCPVQPNGPLNNAGTKQFADVTLIPSISLAGFGCPCHGGQYDTEGNRIAGPPVRALDRYSFSIRNEHLFVGKPFSVSHVDGTGAMAKIHKWKLSFPGEHVNGIESWLYPVQPPH